MLGENAGVAIIIFAKFRKLGGDQMFSEVAAAMEIIVVPGVIIDAH